jgi:hypothetical protein
MRGFDASFRHAAALRDLVEQGFFDPDTKEEILRTMRELLERYEHVVRKNDTTQEKSDGTA